MRRQWHVDFIADPADSTEEALVQATFARLFDPNWDGGDDVDRYPSYGPYWQALNRPWTERLRALGIFDFAARHASAVHAHHAGSGLGFEDEVQRRLGHTPERREPGVLEDLP